MFNICFTKNNDSGKFLSNNLRARHNYITPVKMSQYDDNQD